MPHGPNEPLPGAPDPWRASDMPAFRSRPPYLMSEMIAAEPGLADRLVHRLAGDAAVADLAKLVREAAIDRRPIVVTGCGTSEHAAAAIAELLNEALASPAGHEVRSTDALSALRRPLRDGVLVAVSHEGGTMTTIEALRSAHAAGARTAVITVGDGSPAAAIAEVVVRTEEQDQSWCHTVGYLSPLIAGVMLASRLGRGRPDALAIRALLDVTDDPHAAADIASAFATVDRVVVVGSGPDVPSARELALKIAEGARLPASALDLETVLHGHLAAATRWTGLVVLLTDAAAEAPVVTERTTKVLRAARSLGVPAAAILGDGVAGAVAPEETPAGRVVLPRGGRVRGVAGSLLAATIPLQLIAERLARARGVNPDTLGREDAAQAAAHA